MAHHPLTFLLQKVFADAAGESRSQARPSGEDRAAVSDSRRRFLKNSALAAGSLFIPPVLKAGPFIATSGKTPAYPGDQVFGSDPDPVKVAIVGAGMAGLNAAYQLK